MENEATGSRLHGLNEKAHEIYDTANQKAHAIYDTARDKLRPADEWVRRMTRDHPVAMLCGAVGAGYVIARLVRR